MGYGRPPVRMGSYARHSEAMASGAWGTWRWECQDSACETCNDYDGDSYETEAEIPERPHPNCCCVVSYVIAQEHHKKWKDMKRRNSRRANPDHAKGGKPTHHQHRSKSPGLWTNPKTGKQKY